MEQIAIIYWSQTGNTKAMAEAIKEGVETVTPAALYQVSEISPAEAANFEKLLLGCPAMGDEVLEEDEFEPFFIDLEKSISGKKVALFGSYDWGDGEWMRNWVERTVEAGAAVYQNEGLIIHEEPDADGVAECQAFGKGFATF